MTAGYLVGGVCYTTKGLAGTALAQARYPQSDGAPGWFWSDIALGANATTGVITGRHTYVSAVGPKSVVHTFSPYLLACVVEDTPLPDFRVPAEDFSIIAGALAGVAVLVASVRMVRSSLTRFHDPL